MAFVDFDSDSADADTSLSSGLLVTLEENLDHCYEQSAMDCPAIGENVFWSRTLADSETWERLGDWIGMPIPLRTLKDGSWRPLRITVDARSDATANTALIRAYLTTVPYVSRFDIDKDAGIIGVDSYDEVTVPSSTFTSVTFDITPEQCDVRDGDGSVDGITVPVVWLSFLVWADTAGKYVDIRCPRWREVIA